MCAVIKLDLYGVVAKGHRSKRGAMIANLANSLVPKKIYYTALSGNNFDPSLWGAVSQSVFNGDSTLAGHFFSCLFPLSTIIND